MTHTNHRQGTIESLSKDYVPFIFACRGINDGNALPKLQEFLRMALEHDAVNAGQIRMGNMFCFSSSEELLEAMGKAERIQSVYTVFDDREKVLSLLEDVVKADLGLSVVVSGLFDEIEKMCQALGIKRHTAQCSLGVWGKTEKLPPQEILDITTMCGHGMVSANLVRQTATEVRRGMVSLEKAGQTLARPCVCGVFNPKRAEELLKRCIATDISNNI